MHNLPVIDCDHRRFCWVLLKTKALGDLGIQTPPKYQMKFTLVYSISDKSTWFVTISRLRSWNFLCQVVQWCFDDEILHGLQPNWPGHLPSPSQALCQNLEAWGECRLHRLSNCKICSIKFWHTTLFTFALKFNSAKIVSFKE